MLMRIVFLDHTWFVGQRGRREVGFIWNHETPGTHHFTIQNNGTAFTESMIGEEVAVPICQVRYFQLNYSTSKK